ncbi:hypothetical protein ANTPLA_LOCUS563, partial [Anthophora plagiata]
MQRAVLLLCWLPLLNHCHAVNPDECLLYRLLLRRLQQLGQTSRWHVHIPLLSPTISVEYRLPALHVHRSTRRNCQADVPSLQYPSRSTRV